MKKEDVRAGDYIKGIGVVVSTEPLLAIHEDLTSYGKLEINDGVFAVDGNEELELVIDAKKVSTFLKLAFCDIQDSINRAYKDLSDISVLYESTTIKSERILHSLVETGDIIGNELILRVGPNEDMEGMFGSHQMVLMSHYVFGDILCQRAYKYYNLYEKDNLVTLRNTCYENILDIYTFTRNRLNATIQNLQQTNNFIQECLK